MFNNNRMSLTEQLLGADGPATFQTNPNQFNRNYVARQPFQHRDDPQNFDQLFLDPGNALFDLTGARAQPESDGYSNGIPSELQDLRYDLQKLTRAIESFQTEDSGLRGLLKEFSAEFDQFKRDIAQLKEEYKEIRETFDKVEEYLSKHQEWTVAFKTSVDSRIKAIEEDTAKSENWV
ncbi:hypothetical protein K432DRAFT_396507 [Lepidopterella palustris CBS 459.81]|uniref:Uncharacterized protein n=1 Tax=Lepidopterella palustris CBS 459.81 TaxID=1314670 RepID=A0A8E2JBC9_9PEZI|nr:hypothetical protein K432DRAFT_396507 [Lepidopterella palustris CBS 459.81]